MKKTIALVGCCIALASFNLQAEEAKVDANGEAKIEGKKSSFVDWLKEGKLRGTVGTYAEYTESDYKGAAADEDAHFGWGTGYVKLGYETARMGDFKLGVEAIQHFELWNSDYSPAYIDGSPYDDDIEDKFAISQAWLRWYLSDDTSLTVGRFAHEKFTHIDDTHSEGAYLHIKELSDAEFYLGVVRSFAELDYDDGEDFGAEDDSQDLGDNDTYGEHASDYLFFVEMKWNVYEEGSESVTLNPYIYYQDGYAGVYGLDAVYKKDNYGVKFMGYHVDVASEYQDDVADVDDSTCWAIAPFIKHGNMTYTLGYARFDGDDDDPAMNKPEWVRDYMTGFDQDKEYGNQDCDILFAKAEYQKDAWKASLGYGIYSYDDSIGQNVTTDQSNELQLIVGYTHTDEETEKKVWDAELRLFDVNYDSVGSAAYHDDDDYQKVEMRIRYHF